MEANEKLKLLPTKTWKRLWVDPPPAMRKLMADSIPCPHLVWNLRRDPWAGAAEWKCFWTCDLQNQHIFGVLSSPSGSNLLEVANYYRGIHHSEIVKKLFIWETQETFHKQCICLSTKYPKQPNFIKKRSLFSSRTKLCSQFKSDDDLISDDARAEHA